MPLLHFKANVSKVHFFAYKSPNNANLISAEDSNADRESDYAIYRRCNHRSTFSEQELQIALQYFINKSKNALIKPKRAPCQRLKVRREFRCLSHQERLVLVNALKQLYNNDTLINRMTEVHARYWPAWHKSVEASAAHSQIINIIENALDSIVPGLTMPYWVKNNINRYYRSQIFDYRMEILKVSHQRGVSFGIILDAREIREMVTALEEDNSTTYCSLANSVALGESGIPTAQYRHGNRQNITHISIKAQTFHTYYQRFTIFTLKRICLLEDIMETCLLRLRHMSMTHV